MRNISLRLRSIMEECISVGLVDYSYLQAQANVILISYLRRKFDESVPKK